jgi:hypothetical protein
MRMSCFARQYADQTAVTNRRVAEALGALSIGLLLKGILLTVINIAIIIGM